MIPLPSRHLAALTFCVVLTSVLIAGRSHAQGEWDQKPDSLLAPLAYPARFDSIDVLGCDRGDVRRWFGAGYYSEVGGHGGTSYFTSPQKDVVLRIEWGTDSHVDQISFSRGEQEDLPDSIHSMSQLPDSAVSARLSSNLTLQGALDWGRPLIKCYDFWADRPVTPQVRDFGSSPIRRTTEPRGTCSSTNSGLDSRTTNWSAFGCTTETDRGWRGTVPNRRAPASR